MKRFRIALLVLVLLGVALPQAACKKAAPSALTLDMLRNAEYRNEWPQKGAAKLKDGQYEEEIVPGAASKTVIALMPDRYAFGDLNGDAVDDAAVVLVASGGGSGSFVYLEAVLNDKGAPKHVAEAALGDRTRIDSIAIQAGQITVDVVTHGPSDPMCCPSLKATKKFKLQGEKLVEL